MYCPKCGKETEQSGKFCQWCGAELKDGQDRPFSRKRVGSVKTEKFSETIRMLNQYYNHLPRTDAAGQVVNAIVPPQIIFSVFIFLILIPWVYFAYFYSSKNQGTLGNMAVRVAVTDMEGNRITFGRATLRFFAMYLCLFTILIGFLVIAFTAYKQGLHDKIAATLVFRQ
jgi:hypothetical protein